MPEDVLEPDLKAFFSNYRLKRAPRASTCGRIMRYVLRGNRTLGITADRRADIVRQLQIEWNGQRVDYMGLRTGTVLYIMPVIGGPGGRTPQFEAMVRWDELITGSKMRTTAVGLTTLKHLAP